MDSSVMTVIEEMEQAVRWGEWLDGGGAAGSQEIGQAEVGPAAGCYAQPGGPAGLESVKSGRQAAWNRLRLVEIMERFYDKCVERGRMDDFSFAFAVYCNMYIQVGFQAQLGNWDFSEFGCWFGTEGSQGEYYRCLWLGIRDQSDRWFKKALERLPGDPVTAMYLFIRRAACVDWDHSGSRSWQPGEEQMWRYFELLPAEYREYALGGPGGPHRRWLPYILFCGDGASRKESGPVFGGRIARELFLSRRCMFWEDRAVKERSEMLEAAERDRNRAVEYYLHSWKHTAYPMTVRSAAQELAAVSPALAGRLCRAYRSQRALLGGLELLKYSLSGSDGQLRSAFAGGFYLAGAKSGITVEEVLRESLDAAVFKRLAEDWEGDGIAGEGDGIAREAAAVPSPSASLSRFLRKSARDSYLHLLSLSPLGVQDIFNWFDQNIFPIKVSIDPVWSSIRLKESGFAHSLLAQLAGELFTNLLAHGGGWCRVRLESDDRTLRLIVSNGRSQEHPGTGQGLKSMAYILNALSPQLHGDSVAAEQTGSAYEVTLAFSRGLMARRGRRS